MEEVKDALRRKGHTTSDRHVREFLHRLEEALSIYLPIRDVETSLEKKSNIRRHLERLGNGIHTSLAVLNCSDKLSQALLAREHANGINEFRRQLEAMTVTVDRALAAANALPNKHSTIWRRLIADSVALYMRDYLRVRPTGAKDGMFDEILALVFETIFYPLADVNKLARDALTRLPPLEAINLAVRDEHQP